VLKFRSGILFITFFAVSLMTVIAWAVYLPKTGQTICYDVSGYEATCPPIGDTSCNKLSNSESTTCPPSQDGTTIEAGESWPDPRFTDNGDQTITDNLTGLVWTKNADTPTVGACIGGSLTWQEALNYVACLNSVNYRGYNDWRLPNVNELESIFNAGFNKETCDGSPCSTSGDWLMSHGFVNMNWYYWSSTTSASDSLKAWYGDIFYGYGNISTVNKDNSYKVLPVRGPVTTGSIQLPKTGQKKCYDAAGAEITCGTSLLGQDGEIQAGAASPSPRFSLNSTVNAVTDNLTGLMWLKDANCAAASKTWADALYFVAYINAGSQPDCSAGYEDWRLPNRKELFSLFDYSQSNPALPLGNPFSNAGSNNYWTSTTLTNPWGSEPYERALISGMDLGNISYANKFTNYYVWPVRDTPNISLSPSSLSFPDTNVGSSSASQLITIMNKGTANLTISGINKLGDDTMFNVAVGSGPNACTNLTPTFAPGSKCTLEVTFAPGLAGNKSASLEIQSNDPDEPNAYAGAAGRGLVTLNVAISPATGGTVTGSSITGANINCPGDCSEVYNTAVVVGVTLAAVPQTGYLFSGWTGCNSVTEGQCNVITDTNKNVTAVFAPKSLTITISAGANGSISPATTVVDYGSNKTFDIIPAAGYHTKEVIVDGVSKGALIAVSFTNIIGDHSIFAVFEADLYTVTTGAGPNGKLSCAPATVSHGEGSTCTLTPDADYQVEDIKVNGVSVGKAVIYSVSNISSNRVVTASFSIKKYNLTISKTGSGTVSVSPPGAICGADCYTYNKNQRMTVTAKANQDQFFTGWTGGCSGKSICQVTMSADKNITANFEAAAPVISVLPDGSQDFGDVRVGRVRTRTLKITNNGTGNLRITSVEFDGTDNEMFSKRSGTATIKPGKSSNIRVMFKPRSAGEKTASLMISSNDPAAPVVEIALTGHGILK